MKKIYSKPENRVYAVSLTKLIAESPQPGMVDDSNKVISGEDGGNQELGRQTSGSSTNIWDNQW